MVPDQTIPSNCFLPAGKCFEVLRSCGGPPRSFVVVCVLGVLPHAADPLCPQPALGSSSSARTRTPWSGRGTPRSTEGFEPWSCNWGALTFGNVPFLGGLAFKMDIGQKQTQGPEILVLESGFLMCLTHTHKSASQKMRKCIFGGIPSRIKLA